MQEKSTFCWKRTNFENFPNVYSRFKVNDPDSNTLINYRIQDIPEDRFDDVVEFMARDEFLLEEPFHNGIGIMNDPEALMELKQNFLLLLKQKVSLICFKEESDDIVAVNLLCVQNDEERNSSEEGESTELKKMSAIVKFMLKKSIPFEPQGIEFILEGMGLSVDKKHQRRGIATKMLETRILLLENLGLTTTCRTIYSSTKSQNAAIKAGYTEYLEITYDELLANGYHLDSFVEKSMKTMGYQILK